jgi:hypothetical protein
MPLAYIHFLHEGPVDPGWSGGVAPPGGQPPLGIWGGPFQPPYPSQGPGFPTQPIYIPGPPGQPPIAVQLPVFPPEATHPIQLPPDVAPPEIEGKRIEWKTAWSQSTGWVVIGIPQGNVPTPSAQSGNPVPPRR